MIAKKKLVAPVTLAALGAAIAVIIGPDTVEANTEQVLYNFEGQPSGGQPMGGLIRDDKGNFTAPLMPAAGVTSALFFS